MKHKTGCKEIVIMMVIFTVPQLICNFIRFGIIMTSSGYWLNFSICTLLFFLMILPLNKSYSQTLNVYTRNNIIEKVISITFTINIFLLSLYNLQICTQSLYSLVKSSFKIEILVFLPVLTAIICSYLGIEAISRMSYFFTFICAGIFLLIYLVTSGGLNVQNIYPVLGNSPYSTFFNVSSIGVYMPLLAVYVMRDNINQPQKIFCVLKRSILWVHIVGMALIILCILAIPHPMINFYEFSLAGIFSIAKSGIFFHRFEILLIFLMVIFDTMSLSIGISMFSEKLSDLTNSHDYRPFSLIGGVLLFYLCILVNKTILIQSVYYLSCFLLYLFLVFKCFVLYFKPRIKKGIK